MFSPRCYRLALILGALLTAALPAGSARAERRAKRAPSRIEKPTGGATIVRRGHRPADDIKLPDAAIGAPTSGVPATGAGSKLSVLDAINANATDSSNPAVKFHKKADAAEAAEPREAKPGKKMIREPWLSPAGERIAALVEERYLTKADLDSRVDIAVKQDDPIQNADPQTKKDLEYERRLKYAGEILDEWVANTTLALEAERNGIKVTAQEVNDSVAKLVAGTPGGGAQVTQQMKMVGVPEAQLRAEARDALLVEKFIMTVVRQYDQSVYKKVFDAEPATFLIPPRVRAFHIFRQVPPGATEKELKEMGKQMEKLRRDVSGKNPDFAALTKLSDKEGRLSIGDMGWVQADAQLPPELSSALFGLKPGTTSDVFRSASGLHVVRVLEREEGSGKDLKAATPQIENYLFGRTKPAVYHLVRPRYTIRVNTGGLNRWKEVASDDPGSAATDRRPKTRDLPEAAKPIATPAPPAVKRRAAPVEPPIATPTAERAKAVPAAARPAAKPKAKGAAPAAAPPVVDLPE